MALLNRGYLNYMDMKKFLKNSSKTLVIFVSDRYCRCEFKIPIVIEKERPQPLAQTGEIDEEELIVTAYTKVSSSYYLETFTKQFEV